MFDRLITSDELWCFPLNLDTTPGYVVENKELTSAKKKFVCLKCLFDSYKVLRIPVKIQIIFKQIYLIHT